MERERGRERHNIMRRRERIEIMRKSAKKQNMNTPSCAVLYDLLIYLPQFPFVFL
jgi:hypothetical protein